MSQNKTSVGYKRFYPWLKWVFSALSLYFFYQQIAGLDSNLIADIGVGIQKKPILFLLIVILAFVNWNAEAQKFKLLIAGEAHLSNFKSLKRAFLMI